MKKNIYPVQTLRSCMPQYVRAAQSAQVSAKLLKQQR